MRRLGRLARLGPAGLLLLVRAQWLLLRAHVLLRRRPAGTIVSAADSRGETVSANAGMDAAATARAAGGSAAIEDAGLARARVAEQAVLRAAAYGVFRPLCLVRAVALHWLLEQQGVRGSRIVVGVQREAGAFDAHAWVEYRGHVLGDGETAVGRFVPLSGARLRVRG
jgi:hypothetical protein